MRSVIKNLLRGVLQRQLVSRSLELVHTPKVGRDYTNMGEQEVIRKYLQSVLPDNPFVPPGNRYFVDIGASWGVESSNTLWLAQAGWSGFAAEYDPEKFARLARNWKDFSVSLHRGRVMPENVVALLQAAKVPAEFTFLSLDIDSYDGYVLERLLTAYRPRLVCAEINETIPPPVKFSICPSDLPLWNGGSFFGASIAYMADVADRAGYILLAQQYNNVFFAPQECGLPGITAETAYATGYRDKPDRDAKFPYNAWMSELWPLAPEQLLDSVKARFDGKDAPFTLSL